MSETAPELDALLAQHKESLAATVRETVAAEYRKREIEVAMVNIEPASADRARKLMESGATLDEVRALYGKKVEAPPFGAATTQTQQRATDEPPSGSNGSQQKTLLDKIAEVQDPKISFHAAQKMIRDDPELRSHFLKRG